MVQFLTRHSIVIDLIFLLLGVIIGYLLHGLPAFERIKIFIKGAVKGNARPSSTKRILVLILKTKKVIAEYFKCNSFIFILSVYILLFVTVILISPKVFLILKWVPIDSDSARTLLSTLASSQASIIAIVIALTLVAIQIVAEAYSLRAVEVFRWDGNFWIILFIYIISIIYDVLLLNAIENQSNTTILSNIQVGIKLIGIKNIEDLISFAIRFGVFAFMALFIFIPCTISSLNAKNIIKSLGNRVKIEEFQNTINVAYRDSPSTYSPRILGENDKIIPLIEIIKKAIKEDNSTTAKIGITELKNICIKIIHAGGERDGIIRHFCEHFMKINNFSLERNDEDSVIEIAESLREIGETAIDEGLEFRIWW